MEEKLVAHSQALENIIRTTLSNKDYIKQLIENLSYKICEPNMPEKVEVPRPNRRTYAYFDNNNQFLKIGKNISKYGNLFKDMILSEIKREDDPKTIVENSASFEEKAQTIAHGF